MLATHPGALSEPRPKAGGSAAGPAAGRVGPNAITRVAEALLEILGPQACERVFRHADLERHLAAPPQAMVDETEVSRLHASLFTVLGGDLARSVARDAGRRTGDYLIGHRIPRAIGLILRALPAGLAAPLLVSAIRKHAWTFAGSGRFTVERGPPLIFIIEHCPICARMEAQEPACHYYVATFQRLFQQLVCKTAVVREVECAAAGAPACRFEVRLKA